MQAGEIGGVLDRLGAAFKVGRFVRYDPAEVWRWLREEGIAEQYDWIVLSRAALLKVDTLLHAFFLPEHQHARYTCWGLEVPTDEDDEAATDEEQDVLEGIAEEELARDVAIPAGLRGKELTLTEPGRNSPWRDRSATGR